MKQAWILGFLVLIGCATPKQTSLPPLPWSKVYDSKRLPNVEKLLETRQGGVVISWDNPATPFASNYTSAVEISTDLSTWQEVGRFPYQPTGSLSLTNQPGMQFFRVCNTIRE